MTPSLTQGWTSGPYAMAPPVPPGRQTGALAAIPPLGGGYSLNHLLYQDKRNQAARTAYAGSTEEVVLSFWLMEQPAKQNQKPQPIGVSDADT